MYHCYFLINYIGPPKVFFLSFGPLFKKFAHHWHRYLPYYRRWTHWTSVKYGEKKKTWRISLSIGVRTTVIRWVVHLLRIFKMFHWLMNNPVLSSASRGFNCCRFSEKICQILLFRRDSSALFSLSVVPISSGVPRGRGLRGFKPPPHTRNSDGPPKSYQT